MPIIKRSDIHAGNAYRGNFTNYIACGPMR